MSLVEQPTDCSMRWSVSIKGRPRLLATRRPKELLPLPGIPMM